MGRCRRGDSAECPVVPGLLLFWACPVIAIVGGRSAFGAPVYAPVRFLGGRISMACWLIGAVGLYDLIR